LTPRLKIWVPLTQDIPTRFKIPASPSKNLLQDSRLKTQDSRLKTQDLLCIQLSELIAVEVKTPQMPSVECEVVTITPSATPHNSHNSSTTSTSTTRTNSTDCILSSVEGRAANALTRRYSHQQVEFKGRNLLERMAVPFNSIPDDPNHISSISKSKVLDQPHDQTQSSIYNHHHHQTQPVLEEGSPQALNHQTLHSDSTTSPKLKASKLFLWWVRNRK
jgi:hypothetical protein